MQWLFRLLRIDQDSLRELRIDNYRRQMDAAETRLQRRVFWDLMQDEINKRSPEQIARMERERGLV
ncbi:MAG: hypothetical protein ACYC2K_01665 [Gemmatimonadales bacterium]